MSYTIVWWKSANATFDGNSVRIEVSGKRKVTFKVNSLIDRLGPSYDFKIFKEDGTIPTEKDLQSVVKGRYGLFIDGFGFVCRSYGHVVPLSFSTKEEGESYIKAHSYMIKKSKAKIKRFE